ncbi:MAG: hypothetical protein ACJ8C4_17305 [Gemmataceae bacterium]
MLQRLLIFGIICLAPLLTYCLILVGLNTRRRASLIPGTWDFAGVLLACAGFILCGGPVVLAGLNATWRWYVLHGRVSEWAGLVARNDSQAMLLWLLFFLFVVSGSLNLIRRRRKYTIIYNADIDHIWSALEWVFGRLAIVWQRKNNRYDLQKPLRPIASWRPGIGPPEPVGEERRQERAQLAVHVLPSSRNITLHWEVLDPEVRSQVEAELIKLLPNMRAADNPAVSWFVTASITLFGIIVFALVFLLVAAVRWRQTIGI